MKQRYLLFLLIILLINAMDCGPSVFVSASTTSVYIFQKSSTELSVVGKMLELHFEKVAQKGWLWSWTKLDNTYISDNTLLSAYDRMLIIRVGNNYTPIPIFDTYTTQGNGTEIVKLTFTGSSSEGGINCDVNYTFTIGNENYFKIHINAKVNASCSLMVYSPSFLLLSSDYQHIFWQRGYNVESFGVGAFSPSNYSVYIMNFGGLGLGRTKFTFGETSGYPHYRLILHRWADSQNPASPDIWYDVTGIFILSIGDEETIFKEFYNDFIKVTNVTYNPRVNLRGYLAGHTNRSFIDGWIKYKSPYGKYYTYFPSNENIYPPPGVGGDALPESANTYNALFKLRSEGYMLGDPVFYSLAAGNTTGALYYDQQPNGALVSNPNAVFLTNLWCDIGSSLVRAYILRGDENALMAAEKLAAYLIGLYVRDGRLYLSYFTNSTIDMANETLGNLAFSWFLAQLYAATGNTKYLSHAKSYANYWIPFINQHILNATGATWVRNPFYVEFAALNHAIQSYAHLYYITSNSTYKAIFYRLLLQSFASTCPIDLYDDGLGYLRSYFVTTDVWYSWLEPMEIYELMHSLLIVYTKDKTDELYELAQKYFAVVTWNSLDRVIDPRYTWLQWTLFIQNKTCHLAIDERSNIGYKIEYGGWEDNRQGWGLLAIRRLEQVRQGCDYNPILDKFSKTARVSVIFMGSPHSGFFLNETYTNSTGHAIIPIPSGTYKLVANISQPERLIIKVKQDGHNHSNWRVNITTGKLIISGLSGNNIVINIGDPAHRARSLRRNILYVSTVTIIILVLFFARAKKGGKRREVSLSWVGFSDLNASLTQGVNPSNPPAQLRT